jgi:hypothetical protein
MKDEEVRELLYQALETELGGILGRAMGGIGKGNLPVSSWP